MATITESTAHPEPGYRPCSNCKRGRIRATDARKTCDKCRERKNLYQQRYYEKRTLAALQAQRPDSQATKQKTDDVDSMNAIQPDSKKVKGHIMDENGGNSPQVSLS
ncbi:hypothetical protein C0991_003772 [Blastosporella zonata]|nr:hypothetical protein C0991_003772 [Blastosporella zonata]